MGHITNSKEEIYRVLAERLHKNPVGAPVNEEFLEILYRLYSESEALVGGKFPMVPVTLSKAAAATGIPESALQKTLEDMAGKGLIVVVPRRDTTYYMLVPMIVGFFEHTFMRARDDIDLKELAQLFDKYFQNIEVGIELLGGETKFFNTLIYESIIPVAVETEVLNYERASEVIRKSGGGAISLCACRHKNEHLGKKCDIDAPLEVCTTLGEMAQIAVRLGWAKPAPVDELLRVLDQTEQLGLVHLCDNVLNEPAFICHCCGCCCGMLNATREYGIASAHPSNFLPVLDVDSCQGCATCAERCQINAIVMREAEGGDEVAEVKADLCLGCGICAAVCPSGALTMARRTALYQPPADKTALLTRMAGERGKELKLDPDDFLL